MAGKRYRMSVRLGLSDQPPNRGLKMSAVGFEGREDREAQV